MKWFRYTDIVYFKDTQAQERWFLDKHIKANSIRIIILRCGMRNMYAQPGSFLGHILFTIQVFLLGELVTRFAILLTNNIKTRSNLSWGRVRELRKILQNHLQWPWNKYFKSFRRVTRQITNTHRLYFTLQRPDLKFTNIQPLRPGAWWHILFFCYHNWFLRAD